MILRPFLAALALAAPAPAQEMPPAYVGSAACVGCHTEAAEAWRGSDHQLAWTEPTAENIVADFDGTSFSHDGMTARFRVEPDGSHRLAVTENDGTTTDYAVHSVAGIRPLQQYLIETEPGRIQSFDVVWDTERGGWFHLYPDQHLVPDDGMHWTGPYKTWNARCAECHATGYDKGFDPTTGNYASTEVEIGVGCEACHGPGGAHVDWAEGGGEGDDTGLTTRFDRAEATIQQCAGCHSRREAHGSGNPLPGTSYHAAYNLALLRPGLYHADGQILDEVYEYGSFLQSRMYAQGVSCSDCHDPHSTRLRAEGNAVCARCHSPEGDPGFPQAAGLYDAPEHHFHETGSTGAQCKGCHMTERVYMGVDARRDHSFRVPRPDLAAETGAPDACTDCHDDREPAWAAETIRRWFPDDAHRGPHYGQVLARGREDAVSAASDLGELAADTGEPGIVRATALWLLQQANSPATATRLAPLLADGDPVVRAAAAGLQRSAPPEERTARLSGVLGDPVRNVRIAAARAMLDVPPETLPPSTAYRMSEAMGDWQASIASRTDFPETHLQIAGTGLLQRNFPLAEMAFAEAVRLDPQLVDAWVMRVRIAAEIQGPAAAREILDEALDANPDDPTLGQFDAELR